MDHLLLGLVDLVGAFRWHIPGENFEGSETWKLHRIHAHLAQPLVLPLSGYHRSCSDSHHQPSDRSRPQRLVERIDLWLPGKQDADRLQCAERKRDRYVLGAVIT